MKKSVLIGLGLAVAVGIGGWLWWMNQKVDGYPRKVRETFLSSCMDAAKAKLAGHEGAKSAEAGERARTYCECALQSIVKRFTLEEFANIDKNMQTSGTIDPAVQKRLNEAVGECSLEGAQEKAAAPAKP